MFEHMNDKDIETAFSLSFWQLDKQIALRLVRHLQYGDLDQVAPGQFSCAEFSDHRVAVPFRDCFADRKHTIADLLLPIFQLCTGPASCGLNPAISIRNDKRAF